GLAHVLVLTLASGVLRGVEHATRQGYTHDVVGPTALMQGFAVLGVGMRTGWLLGSLGAGAATLLLVSTPPRTSTHAPPASLWGSVVEFLTAVKTDRALLVLIVLTAG